jgi:hypothetical protein
MPVNDRGSLVLFRLPPESEVWDELKGPVAEYRDLVGRRHAALTRIGVLESKRARAAEADRLALARALREEKPDPGDKSVEKIDKDLANTRRIIESLEIAIEEVEQELIGIVDEHQAEWLESANEQIEAETQEYVAAIDTLEAARSKVAASVGLKRFLHTFPEHGYSAGHWPVFGLLRVGSQGPGDPGEPYFWNDVVEALRKDAEVAVRPKREEPEAQSAQGGGIVEHFNPPRAEDHGGRSANWEDRGRVA